MKRLALGYALALLVLLTLADCGVVKPLADRLTAYQVDKLIHFVLYGVLALVLNAALASRPRMTWLRAIATGSILVLIASTVDETTNLFSPYRTWSMGDLAANCLGILCLGIVPCAWFAASPLVRFGNTGQHER